MAITKTPKGTTAGRLVKEATITATLSPNVGSGAVTIHTIKLLSTEATPDANTSVKLFDSNGSGVTPGTTAPTLVLYLDFPTDTNLGVTWTIVGGLAFSNGLSWFGANQDGIGASATSPTDATNIEVAVS